MTLLLVAALHTATLILACLASSITRMMPGLASASLPKNKSHLTTQYLHYLLAVPDVHTDSLSCDYKAWHASCSCVINRSAAAGEVPLMTAPSLCMQMLHARTTVLTSLQACHELEF